MEERQCVMEMVSAASGETKPPFSWPTSYLSEKEIRGRVLALDLSCIAWKFYLPKKKGGYGWSLSKIKRVENAYRGLLFDFWKYPNKFGVPNEDMDEYWHNHILFSRKYFQDCDFIFGRYLHHNPNFGMPKITKIFLKKYK